MDLAPLLPLRWRPALASSRPAARDGHRSALPPSLSRASAVMDDALLGPHGEPLGTVIDLLIDLDQGCIAYAVAVSGGFMGLGERLHAIPFAALQRQDDRHSWTLSVDALRLQDAPSFDQQHWPARMGLHWHERLHRHYGVQPAWLGPDAPARPRPRMSRVGEAANERLHDGCPAQDPPQAP